jgi:sugar phosphate isomerase/epimerase
MGALAISGTFVSPALFAAESAAKPRLFSAMGVSGSIDKAAMLKSKGAEFLTEGVGNFLVPDQDDAAFAKNLEKLGKSPLPVLACNGFIRPAHLRAVGKEANHDQIMEWSVTAFRRLKQADGKFIVFGSSGARALRDGWPKEKADKQFVALLKLMGPAAAEHGVTVVVEQLQASECNYINHIGEAAALIRETAHPNIRLLADFFHMTRMGDTPADLKAAMDVVVHIEIAENKGRTYPGVMGDDFRPFLRVLRESGYHGAVSIEGRGTDDQLAPAFAEIARQASEI